MRYPPVYQAMTPGAICFEIVARDGLPMLRPYVLDDRTDDALALVRDARIDGVEWCADDWAFRARSRGVWDRLVAWLAARGMLVLAEDRRAGRDG